MAAKNRMVAARDNLKKDFVETLKAYHDVEDSDWFMFRFILP